MLTDCNQDTPQLLVVETEKAIYEIEFGQIQIEITGRCNMKCHHCRAAQEAPIDVPIDRIIKVIEFARQFSPNYKEVVVSGGEPLLHHHFPQVLEAVKNNGCEFVTLTTNGSLLSEEHLRLIEDLKFNRFTLSISLDSLDSSEHDSFRQCKGAFDKAVNAISLINKRKISNVITSLRTTLRPHQIPQMEKMTKFAYDMGCQRISFSSIHPAGRAISQPDLWMNRHQKREFIEKIYKLKGNYGDLLITTNDPLKSLVRGYHDIGNNDTELVFDGCVACAVSFNVSANGNMTPCALINLPIMNVSDLTIEEMTKNYQENDIVKNMLDMNLKGKCGECEMKYQCGGCRARALIQNGDYLAEDPDCWL